MAYPVIDVDIGAAGKLITSGFLTMEKIEGKKSDQLSYTGYIGNDKCLNVFQDIFFAPKESKNIH